MKRTILLAAWLAIAQPASAHTLPSLMLSTSDGRTLDFAEFKGRTVLVDFWASWCAPCLPGLRTLEILKRDYAAHLVIIPVSLDRGGAVAAVRGYAKADIKTLPLYLASPADATARFGIKALPTTILYAEDGREIARFDGPSDMRAQAIRKALASVMPYQSNGEIR